MKIASVSISYEIRRSWSSLWQRTTTSNAFLAICLWRLIQSVLILGQQLKLLYDACTMARQVSKLRQTCAGNAIGLQVLRVLSRRGLMVTRRSLSTESI